MSEIIKNIAVVGTGSFIGGAARYLVSLVMKGISKGFPWATLTVNVLGCFLIGLLWGYFSRGASEGSSWALFLTVGVCGGFTTFSTFSKEALMQAVKDYGAELLYDYSIIPGIAIKIPEGKHILEAIDYFNQVKGLTAVERDHIYHLIDPVQPKLEVM